MPESKPEVEKIRSVISMLSKHTVSAEVRVDLSLARGLDYYTGLVWEVSIETAEGKLPSIASGGRYDNLIGMYSKAQVPAVGSSIGITRVFAVLSNEGGAKTYSKVFIAQIGAGNTEYAIGVARKMRNAGVYVDMNVTDKGISKQLEYSNSLGIRYVAIIGDQERKSGKVKLKDMETGSEELLDVDEAITELKK